MNKTEAIEVVNQTYATWNQALPASPDERKSIYTAWWTLIADLEPAHCTQAIIHLALTETFLPKPGHLRKTVYNLTNPDAPPTPSQAWNQYHNLCQQMNSGNYTPQNIHPALAETIRQVGTELTTGADRNHFTETYTQHTAQYYQP
jgi:hypothetical protein